MKREHVREVIVFENHFKTFRKTLDRESLSKIYQVLTYIMTTKVIPSQYFKSIEGVQGLFEVRCESSGKEYRVFCCFDEDNNLVLFNGFQKKEQKTRKQHLNTAKALLKKYLTIIANQKNENE